MWIKDKWDVTFGNGNCLAYSLSEIQSSTETEFDNVTVDDMPCNYRYMNNNNNTVKLQVLKESFDHSNMNFWKKQYYPDRIYKHRNLDLQKGRASAEKLSDRM